MKLRPLFLLALPVLALSLGAALPQEKKTSDPSGSYAIDTVHSAVIFKCKHVETSWAFGRFNDVAGALTFDAAKPENSKVEITIKTESVDTANKKRDDHLRSPDFLDVKQFPTATFKSKSVAKKGDKTYTVTGELALHGVTKTVSIEMEHVGSNEVPQMGKVIGFFGTLVLKRGDFGIDYGQGALGEEITLTLSIEAAAK